MYTLSKILWISLIVSITVEIAILGRRIEELEGRIEEIPRYIRKEYPSEYDVVDICKGIINVCDKKGTDE